MIFRILLKRAAWLFQTILVMMIFSLRIVALPLALAEDDALPNILSAQYHFPNYTLVHGDTVIGDDLGDNRYTAILAGGTFASGDQSASVLDIHDGNSWRMPYIIDFETDFVGWGLVTTNGLSRVITVIEEEVYDEEKGLFRKRLAYRWATGEAISPPEYIDNEGIISTATTDYRNSKDDLKLHDLASGGGKAIVLFQQSCNLYATVYNGASFDEPVLLRAFPEVNGECSQTGWASRVSFNDDGKAIIAYSGHYNNYYPFVIYAVHYNGEFLEEEIIAAGNGGSYEVAMLEDGTAILFYSNNGMPN